MLLAPNFGLILVLVILLSILVLLEIEYRQLRMDSWRPKRR